MKTSTRAWMVTGVLGMVFLSPGRGAEAPELPPDERPLRIIKLVEPRFPRRLWTAGITAGEVQLFLHVDAHGTLTDHLFVAFTHYEFANEVSRALPRWRYEPTLRQGRAISTTLAMKMRFTAAGVALVERNNLEDLREELPTLMFRARELKELDAVPRVLVSVSPAIPADAAAEPITGRVRVDFFIDETGGVRMPFVREADDERLGWVALSAIAAWTFEVPRRGGHPVLARASQVFVFNADG